MLVLGLMSGTSADAIDVALARISGAPPRLNASLLRHTEVAWPRDVRAAILRVAAGEPTTTAEISHLNALLGEAFAGAALAACKQFRVPARRIALIGSHGQTIFHQGKPGKFLSTPRLASTLQIGDPSIIAVRTGITTVGDFRPADMAAGGQGAPLVPFVDYLLFLHPRRGRIALNIGGIANLTYIPPGARPCDAIAFDTGPGNMLLDALAQHATRGRLRYDRDARLARRGALLPGLLAELLRDDYFKLRPPKSCGREQYGAPALGRVLAWARKNAARSEDLLYTVTLFTSMTIADAIRRFVLPRGPLHDVIVSGGGARNPLMMAQLGAALARICLPRPAPRILTSDTWGLPSDAKEAFAFAVLAYESFHGRAANLPSATGARHPVVLGKVCRAL